MSELQFQIREATEDDIHALSDLMNHLGYPTSYDEMMTRYRSISNHPDYKTFVACSGRIVTGMVGAMQSFFYEQNGLYVRVLALVTVASFRDQGIGTALLDVVEKWASDIGAKSVLLNCGNREERQAAHDFYQKRGYVIKSSGYLKRL